MDLNLLKGREVAVDARFLKRKGIGISRYLMQSVEELIQAGAKVSLLLDDSRYFAELTAAYPEASVVSVPGRHRFLWEQIALRKHLSDSSYDVFIAGGNYGLPLGYRGHTRLVLIVHDVIPLRLPRLYLLTDPVSSVFYLVSTAIATVKADQIVTVSDSSARDIVRLLRRRRVSVVYPQIAPAAPSAPLSPPAGAGHERDSVPPDDFGEYFVYNGGADPRKNVPMLLRAMALLGERCPALKLVVLGSGYDSVLGLIDELDLGERVRLLGYVSEARKTDILSRAVGVVYPSRYEGFGLPLIEGMAAGIPVVTGTGGSLVEVGGSAAFYVRPLNAQQLASTMIGATQDGARAMARTAGTRQLAELTRRQHENRLPNVVAAMLEDA
jgi:glycosyltransferase involved in cell wall biosynthesis